MKVYIHKNLLKLFKVKAPKIWANFLRDSFLMNFYTIAIKQGGVRGRGRLH